MTECIINTLVFLFLLLVVFYFTMHFFNHRCFSLYQSFASGGIRTNDLNIIGLKNYGSRKSDTILTELTWVLALRGNFVKYQDYVHKVYA